MPAPNSRVPYREYRALGEFRFSGSPPNERSHSPARIIMIENSERSSHNVKLAYLRNCIVH